MFNLLFQLPGRAGDRHCAAGPQFTYWSCHFPAHQIALSEGGHGLLAAIAVAAAIIATPQLIFGVE